jgi:tetratricopeptide (TPR) repeat protein
VKRNTQSYSNIHFQEVPGPEQVKLLQKVIGISDMAAFNKEWHEYVKGLIAKLDAKGWYLAANVSHRERKIDEAEAALAKAIELGCKEPGLYFLQGQLSFEKMNLPKAQAAFAQALELEPINARYTFMNGIVRQLIGKKEEGLKLQALAKELDPVGFEVWGDDIKIDGD